MRPEPDVAAFQARAAGYEKGWLGRLHHSIADRTAALSVCLHPQPRRLLDVGCGTGYLLRSLAQRYPEAAELVGVDAAPAMVEAATRRAHDHRLSFSAGVAESLPFADRSFDLVVSTTSFDHWSDQSVGLEECARVLVPGGRLILVDRFSIWLAPSLLIHHSSKARTPRRSSQLLRSAGFHSLVWRDLYALIIKAVTATTLGAAEERGAGS